MSQTTPPIPASSLTYCVGRFQFELAPLLLQATRSQSIYRVNARTVALSAAVPAPLVWSQRLATIRSSARQPAPDPIVRTFELDPGVQAVWYRERPNDNTHATLETLKPFGDHALQLKREISAGQPDVTEQTFRRIAAGYVSQGHRGFCLENGSLTTESSRYEEASISFTDPKFADMRLSFISDAVDQVDPHDPLRDIEDERKVLVESGSEVTILRNERRVVAQLPGVEARIRMKPRGEAPFVRFTWRFDGTARDATAPQMMLVGTAQDPKNAELEAVWDRWLQSMRRVPPSAQR